MELEQMRRLDAIARCGTISAAAEALRLSQPALSRSVRRLERELGQELFDRTHNFATLNDAGRLAVDHARAILRDEQAMRDAFDELARRQRILRIGTVAPAPVWRLTARVVELFPGTLLDPVTLPEDEVERRLVNRQVDLAVTVRPMILTTMRSVPLMVESLSAFLPSDHDFAGQATVSFSDLDGESFLVDRASGWWLDVLRRELPHSQVVEQADRTVFVQLVQTTKLLSFTTEAPQMNPQEGDRVAVPIADGAARATFYLTALADAPARVGQIMDWFVSHEIDMQH